MPLCPAHFEIPLTSVHFVADYATQALATTATVKLIFYDEEKDVVIRYGWIPEEEDKKCYCWYQCFHYYRLLIFFKHIHLHCMNYCHPYGHVCVFVITVVIINNIVIIPFVIIIHIKNTCILLLSLLLLLSTPLHQRAASRVQHPNHVAANSLSPQVARKGSTLSGFVQRSRLEREVGRDLHSNKWKEV